MYLMKGVISMVSGETLKWVVTIVALAWAYKSAMDEVIEQSYKNKK